MSASTFDLSRFLSAQRSVYEQVVDELKAGRKRTHWMWFIFPQLASLGRSPTARFYGLENLAHARAYGQHAVLGPRLQECCNLVLSIDGCTPTQIFGSPDDLKLCSCVTLFEAACPAEPVFGAVVDKLYGGRRDALTLSHLQQQTASDPVAATADQRKP
ncbi:MAG: DUF1810 domain-containing protein [Hyphomicrobiales bacterium]|nr:MAG: DUF1810 domain-containing protein [Hyphomicrobiales bacterium]